jgi:hypothetical protein
MTTDPNAGVISDLAIAEMLNFPKLYGPGFYGGFFAQPEALVVALEQLETAVVDPAQLTSNETVDSVEAQTIDDLQMLAHISSNSLVDVTSPGLGRTLPGFQLNLLIWRTSAHAGSHVM